MTKLCSGPCNTIKTLEAFSKRISAKDGHQNYCKECASLHNKSFIKGYKRAKRRPMTQEEKLAHNAYCVKRYLRPEVRAQIAKTNTNWRLNNPGKANARTARRAAAKAQRTPKWLTSLQHSQISMFYEASAALTKELNIKFEVDHVAPLRGKHVSGLHVPWNLQVIPKIENLMKANK